MTNKKYFKLQRGCHTFATFFATCNAYNNNEDGGRAKSPTSYERWALIGPFWQNFVASLRRGCYTPATCLATLQKVDGRSTFLATCNATIAVAKTCNATFVALQVGRKIASCNMALSVQVWDLLFSGPKLAHLPVQKFVQFHQSRVNARWNRASFCPCKNLSGPV